MEKRTIKKLLAIIMIITVLAADFCVLGNGLVAYAAQATNEIKGYPNIYFSTYFKEGEKEEKQIERSVKEQQLKLYTKIGVNSDVDCLENIQIDLENSDFNIISTNKGTIKDGIVNIDYIGAGTSVEIELGIEANLSNKVSADMIFETNLKLTAKYKNADKPDGEKIKTISKASVKYLPDEATKAKLNSYISTNSVLSVDGTNKRVVQTIIKSSLLENEYPVKQTILNVSIPELSEEIPEISVLAIDELATNGLTEISEENYEIVDGKLQITLKNEVDSNNEISWNKDAFDELIVTYIYPENVDTIKVETKVDSEIRLYNSENVYTATYTYGIERLIVPNVIMVRTETITKELYKGELYANLETEYNSESKIIITNADVADEIIMEEGQDLFRTKVEIPANTTYKTTTLNLNKMLEIFGAEGTITIKNGEQIIVINKDTETDVNGNVIINYDNRLEIIEIKTSKPVKAGVFELQHTKVLANNGYTREQLKEVKSLGIRNKIQAVLDGKSILTTLSVVNGPKLKETSSKAELTIENNKNTLSTTQNNEVTLGITLVTNGAQYDLYKNPKMTLKFPEVVENVELKTEISKQNADEFTVNVGKFNAQNKTMEITLEGEQTQYPETALTQAYLQLNLNITLSKFAISQNDKITMTYINENATQYADEGIVEKAVEISAPSKVLTMFNLSSNENISLTEDILQQVTGSTKELNFNIGLVNNEDSNINNVRILGKLPTTGNTIGEQKINTLETALKNIEAPNAKIYYTENTDATADIENVNNGWTTELLTNAKMYLVKIDTLDRGARYSANVNVEKYNLIEQGTESYTQYEVIYDTETKTNVKETSRTIGLVTYVVSGMKVNLTAQVGNETLNYGDRVKEGEVIKYTATVTNNSSEIRQNIKLELGVPQGTRLVKPAEQYEYAKSSYYNEVIEVETVVIRQLAPGETFTKQYEVRVNTDNKTGTEITNKTMLIYDGTIIGSAIFNNVIQEADARVTIKRTIDESIKLIAGGTTRYMVYVENISGAQINNLEMKMISDAFNIETIENEQIFLHGKEVPEKITIEKIDANDMVYFSIYGSIQNDATELNTYVVVNDLDGNIYRSNVLQETFDKLDAEITLESPQNGGYIKEGDIVEYNITVKNTGDMESAITVKDTIPEFLEIQKIEINGTIRSQKSEQGNIPTDISEILTLKPQQTENIKITTKVGYIPELYHGTVITNNATVEVFGVLKETSEMTTHILKSSLKQDENVENVISGTAWLDLNENGQKDGNEKVLPGIVVKIYDYSSQNYLEDNDGVVLQTRTNNNGEYSFSNIKDGSYLIVFENIENYEPTIAFAEGVDTSINSKAIYKDINTIIENKRVIAIEAKNLQTNTFSMNIGLKERVGELPKPEEPEIPETPDIPENPEQPEKPETPTDPEQPEEPTKPEQPGESEKPEEKETKTISGMAWLDTNRNGQKDKQEITLSGIKVKVYDVLAEQYLKDKNGKLVEATTDSEGKYTLNNIEKGSYVLIFEYDMEKYEPTIYMAEGVSTEQNSKVILKKTNINGQEISVAVTDKINVKDNVKNINIGLKENLIFDLELNKYISRVVVQTSKETKEYKYEDKTFGKVEIHRKQINGALVVLEYTIKVKNNGEITGYAKNVVDYVPTGLTFSSELNKDWYLSENVLHTKSLENVELKPGEEKEIKLILTKTMTGDNVGLINNRAEIYQDYNKYGESDIDSTPNNQAQNEDDFGSVDYIIQIATGGNQMIYMVLFMINLVLIGVAIKLMMKNGIIRIKINKGRR